MIKEIHEQPKAVSDTLNSVVKDGAIDLSEVGLSEEEIKEISQIIKCNLSFADTCHLMVSNIIYISCIFQDRRNI